MKLKISRLFHWLYATLMFLPLLMFIPSCLYYGFNEHATNETTTEINYKYQSNEVNTLDDLVESKIYFINALDINSSLFGFEDSYLDIDLLRFDVIDTTIYDGTLDEIVFNDYDSKNFNYLNVYIGYGYFGLRFTNDNVNVHLYKESDYLSLENVYFRYNSYFNEGLDVFETLPQYTDYNVIESVETNVQDTISNKMYLAWEGVWNLPLFQWTKNSFITAPFSYITGLFGLGSDNSLNCVFTYFASISICWLVFDLIMYVPNLAHRWLDRSAIE